MPPKVQFTKTQIIDAALNISAKTGISSVTVRKIASQLGCSVAPVYVNFRSTDELQDAVMKRIKNILKDYSTRTYTEIGFFNIGIGQLVFVRDYPMLFLDLLNFDHVCLKVPEDSLNWMIKIMEKDEMLQGLDRQQLCDLLNKMSVMTNGLSVMMTRKSSPLPIDEALVMLEETAHQLVVSYRNHFLETFEAHAFINID